MSIPADMPAATNPVVRGWLQCYGAFYRSALQRLRKFKKAHECWQRITRQHPRLFAHWTWTPTFW